jgi:hypothetical protein
MTSLRLFAIGGWTVLAAVTGWALFSLGLAALPETMLRDLHHPWRAQLYLDLELHLVLFAGWMIWREGSLRTGLAAAVATILLGALFTLPYLLAASIRAGGDPRRLLLGVRA